MGMKAVLIVFVVVVIIGASIYFMGRSVPSEMNSNYNDVVAECERHLDNGDESGMRVCDDYLIDMMERRCAENPNYDICTTTKIEDYYRARAGE